ncbi:protein translocase subunit SecF [Litorilituus lipolyticus]|uniref:Protein-export membrane protein SecF n=1 Tax=Litorilituus lipolyticus TaxID=2491017 RepID=A0A502L6J6_9GAMM|nr:protein translocase subunit SecF [Litorilituus lipolyticus]TPH18075.1 protein translocase subunit SecF [Litorilituus lipolyticus]
MTKFRVISFYTAIFVVLFALMGLFSKGLNFGLDFTGGYLTEFSTNQPVSLQAMNEMITLFIADDFQLSSAENGSYWTVRTPDNSASGNSWLFNFIEAQKILAGDIDKALIVTPQDAVYIGSQVGEELINQGGLALLTALVIILLYLSFRFEWRLAIGAVAALFHDVIIVLGIFAWLGLSFDLTILASILAIIGYSLNDSIIVGDRIREIMKTNKENNIDTIINSAIKTTLVRTLITSGTTLATIVAIWFFAGDSLHGFAVSLFSGILVGTFSSIAISATLPKLVGLRADYYQQKALEQEALCQLP